MRAVKAYKQVFVPLNIPKEAHTIAPKNLQTSTQQDNL